MGRDEPAKNASRHQLLTASFALGFSCILTQVAALREMLGVFDGNELVLGVTLGNWLLLMGLGASLARWLNRRCSHRHLGLLLLLTAVLPLAHIVLLRGLRQFIFLRGEAIGVVGTTLVSLFLLMPYCMAAGFFLVTACRVFPTANAAVAAGRVYASDTLGSMAGGVLFSLVLVSWLDHIALLTIPATLNVAVAAWLIWPQDQSSACSSAPGWKSSRALGLAGVLAAVGLLAWVVFLDPDASATARQFPGQQVLFRGNSPYGRLIVTASGGQTNVVENGVLIASTPNIESAEETAHLALAQRPEVKRVLLIGGAISGAAREILRHPVTALDCVEPDPLVIQVGRRFLPGVFLDPRLKLWDADARQYIRHTALRYDAVLLALPDPTTAQLNRFFTEEFFREVRRILNPGGVLSFATGRYENYASPELCRILSCAGKTARRVFPNVLLLPGGRVFFLASDAPLSAEIAPALERAGVATRWVTPGYLAANFTEDRLNAAVRASSQPAPLNRDFSPELYFFHLRHWASQFQAGWHWLFILTGAGTIIYIWQLRSVAAVIFASGFAGSALEVLLLLAMQTLAGSLYRQIAWVVTIFMAGLTLGAMFATRWIQASRGSARKTLCRSALAVAILAISLPIVIRGLIKVSELSRTSSWTLILILIFTFCLAAFIGAQFPLANELASDANAVGRLYSSDFLGAFIGALFTSAWLVPLGGTTGVCWLTGGLNAIAALRAFRIKSSR